MSSRIFCSPSLAKFRGLTSISAEIVRDPASAPSASGLAMGPHPHVTRLAVPPAGRTSLRPGLVSKNDAQASFFYQVRPLGLLGNPRFSQPSSTGKQSVFPTPFPSKRTSTHFIRIRPFGLEPKTAKV